MLEKLRKFTVERPILTTVIVIVLNELIFNIKLFSSLLPDSTQLGGTLDRVIFTAIWILFILFFMKNNLKELGYTFNNFGSGMKIGIWVILISAFVHLLTLASNVLLGKGHFMRSSEEILRFFDYLLLYLSVGLYEETIYRAIPINILRNKKGLSDRKYMFYCLAISSVFFGLVHLMNMVDGFDTPSQAIGRAISCIGTGFLFGAIYWRTGSLLSTIIVHAIWDGFSAVTEYMYIVDEAAAENTGAAAVQSSVGSAVLTALVMAVINVIIALFILRKKKCTGCRIEAMTMREQFFSEV